MVIVTPVSDAIYLDKVIRGRFNPRLWNTITGNFTPL